MSGVLTQKTGAVTRPRPRQTGKKHRPLMFERSPGWLCLPVTSLPLNLDGSEELLRAVRIVITANYGRASLVDAGRRRAGGSGRCSVGPVLRSALTAPA